MLNNLGTAISSLTRQYAFYTGWHGSFCEFSLFKNTTYQIDLNRADSLLDEFDSNLHGAKS